MLVQLGDVRTWARREQVVRAAAEDLHGAFQAVRAQHAPRAAGHRREELRARKRRRSALVSDHKCLMGESGGKTTPLRRPTRTSTAVTFTLAPALRPAFATRPESSPVPVPMSRTCSGRRSLKRAVMAWRGQQKRPNATNLKKNGALRNGV